MLYEIVSIESLEPDPEPDIDADAEAGLRVNGGGCGGEQYNAGSPATAPLTEEVKEEELNGVNNEDNDDVDEAATKGDPVAPAAVAVGT